MRTATVSASPMPERVHFRGDPVQSLSRPLHQREHDLLQDFEDHVLRNIDCYRHSSKFSLPRNCDFCNDITAYILTRFDFRLGKYVQKPWREHCPTIVEIPRAFEWTRCILIQRAELDRGRMGPSRRQSDNLSDSHARSRCAGPSSAWRGTPVTVDGRRPKNRRDRVVEHEVLIGRGDEVMSLVFSRLVVSARGGRYASHDPVEMRHIAHRGARSRSSL